MTEDEEDRLDELYKQLNKIDRKRQRCKTELEYAALLILRREVEEQIWKLDKTLKEY